MVGALELQYLLYLPSAYDESGKDWPLIVFLHGAGERGEDLQRVKAHGPPRVIENGASLPFIVAAPQCPHAHYWDASWLSPLLDQVCDAYRVDQSRLYLTGISMGGYGTWQWACAEPSRFAAIAPICGGGDPKEVCRIKHLPVWAFHGARDDIVPLEESAIMVDALKACGGDVSFTIYPSVHHDSWTQTYNNPQLFKWFLEHQRAWAP